MTEVILNETSVQDDSSQSLQCDSTVDAPATKMPNPKAGSSTPTQGPGSQQEIPRYGDIPRPTLDQQYQALLREHARPEIAGLLKTAQRGCPFLRDYSDWEAVIAFMREGISSDPRKNEILLAILGAHQDDRDPGWQTVLLAIMWPGLRSIHRNKFWYDRDPQERWQVLILTFLEVVHRFDVRKRQHGLVQKLYNDTFSYFYREYQRIWKRSSREILMGRVLLERGVPDRNGMGMAAVDLDRELQQQIRNFKAYLLEGVITEEDFRLLVATRVYRLPIRAYAEERGFRYEALKKKRQRLEAHLRRHDRRMDLAGPRRPRRIR